MKGTSMLSEIVEPPNKENSTIGVWVGIVTNNKDPEGLGRVKVKYPWMSQKDESFWARIVTPMAGKERGIYFLPEVDDEVLVAFESGDMNKPYILGSLWNGKEKPPEKNSDGKNNRRIIKSRSGHQIILDDTQGQEKIIIKDKTEKNEIMIDAKNNTLSVKVEKDMIIEAKGKITVKGGGEMALEGKSMEIKCSGGVKINGSNLEVM